MADDKKTLKFQMMMSPSEAQELDDWMFKNRVRSRAEAIRRLCRIALTEEQMKLETNKLMNDLLTPVLILADAALDKRPHSLEEKEEFRTLALDVFASTYRLYEKQLEQTVRISSLIDGSTNIDEALDWETKISEFIQGNSFLDKLRDSPEAMEVLNAAIERSKSSKNGE